MMFRGGVFSFLLLVRAISAVPAATDTQWPLPNTRPLRFTQDGTFQISVFEDLHYGEGWSN
jgi:hypothetical protein